MISRLAQLPQTICAQNNALLSLQYSFNRSSSRATLENFVDHLSPGVNVMILCNFSDFTHFLAILPTFWRFYPLFGDFTHFLAILLTFGRKKLAFIMKRCYDYFCE
jgi:hypothetical protein